MKRFVIVGVLALLPSLAWAQASKNMNEDWIGFQVALKHVQEDLNAVMAEDQAATKSATDADARLKWVLDNWVGKPPAVLPPKAKP